MCWKKKVQSPWHWRAMIEVFAPAKINLSLHVTGQRPDGYHVLDSLVAFAPFGDRLWVEPASGLSLEVVGPEAQGVPADASNLVFRAARLLSPGKGARIRLEKNIPAASGIGGGSADAAAAIRGLVQLWGLTHRGDMTARDLPQEFLELGADIPMCLKSDLCRVGGVGEHLEFVRNIPAIPVVLVNPRVEIPTPVVFKNLTEKINKPMPDKIPGFGGVSELAGWLAGQRNDLQPVAISLQPVVADVLSAIESCDGVLLARMSGSGASCFGIFPAMEDAQAAAKLVTSRRPDWWVTAGVLGNQGSRALPRIS